MKEFPSVQGEVLQLCLPYEIRPQVSILFGWPGMCKGDIFLQFFALEGPPFIWYSTKKFLLSYI